jgi:hypothetical protein
LAGIARHNYLLGAATGNTTRNIEEAHPTAIALPRTGLEGQPVVILWRIARQVLGNRSIAQAAIWPAIAEEQE